MTKKYTTPVVEIKKLASENLMISFSLGEGGDDQDEAGAKGKHIIEGFMYNDEVMTNHVARPLD